MTDVYYLFPDISARDWLKHDGIIPSIGVHNSIRVNNSCITLKSEIFFFFPLALSGNFYDSFYRAFRPGRSIKNDEFVVCKPGENAARARYLCFSFSIFAALQQ